jgi:hypothetical protein
MALCYKPEGCWFKIRRGEYILSIYLILPAALGSGIYLSSNRDEYQNQNNNVSGEKSAQVRNADKVAAICETTV